MTWARLDDNFPQHPKVVTAGAICELIQVRAICYSCRYLTDGFIPTGALSALATGLEQILNAPIDVLPEHMVLSGLWKARRDGWIIHDFLKYNPSRAQVHKERERKSEGGKRGANARWNNNSDSISHGISHTPSHDEAIPDPIGASNAPLPHRDDGISHRSRSGLPTGFVIFWNTYPKKVGKDAAAAAWRKKGCEPRTDEILAAVERQRSYLMREAGEFIPLPATWLNQGRWQDAPELKNGQGHVSTTTQKTLANLEQWQEEERRGRQRPPEVR